MGRRTDLSLARGSHGLAQGFAPPTEALDTLYNRTRVCALLTSEHTRNTIRGTLNLKISLLIALLTCLCLQSCSRVIPTRLLARTASERGKENAPASPALAQPDLEKAATLPALARL